jgi:cytosine deaminase
MTQAAALVIRNARLRGRTGLVSIGVDGELISAVSEDPLGGEVEVDADGGLVTESFVDAHLHLDKVFTLDRVDDAALGAYTGSDMGGAMTAIELASEVKEGYSQEESYRNARRALLEGLRYGILHVQAFADVDTTIGLEGVRALLRLRAEFRDLVEVRVVAFPQDGLIREPGAEALIRDAVREGADTVGGIPWIELTDADAAEHTRLMCELAAEGGRRVAMLVDDAGDPGLRTTQMLAVELRRLGLVGKGVACHARAMAMWPEPRFRRLVGLARAARLGFVADPHTGPLHLRAFDLIDAGIPVALGQDDIEDAYYPFGRHNLLEVAFLAAHLMEARDDHSLERLYDMVTVMAAEVLAVEGHRLEAGLPANLVVLGPGTVRGALATHEPPRYVVSRGRIVAENTSGSVFHHLPASGVTLDGLRPRSLHA